MLLTNILKTATTRRHVLIFKHTKNKLNYTNKTNTTSTNTNNNYLINNNIYSLTTRHFSEAKAEDDGFFGRFKSMFSGANTSSNVDEEGGGKKKKQKKRPQKDQSRYHSGDNNNNCSTEGNRALLLANALKMQKQNEF